MTILTTADVASIKTVLTCNIANKAVEHANNLEYGLECSVDLELEMDKSSAFLWALNSECELENSLLCKIVAFANQVQFNIDTCNPNVPCVSSRVIQCSLGVTPDEPADPCLLPVDTITILL